MASLGTFGDKALFKHFLICPSWGLWSRVALLASLTGQRLYHPSRQVQQMLLHLLLTVALEVATVHSTSEREKKTQGYTDCSVTRKFIAESEVRMLSP